VLDSASRLEASSGSRNDILVNVSEYQGGFTIRNELTSSEPGLFLDLVTKD
jgi:hypothetical protein